MSDVAASNDRPITAAEVPSLVDAALVLIEESDPAQGVTLRINGDVVYLTPQEAVLLRRLAATLTLRQGVTELQHPGEGD